MTNRMIGRYEDLAAEYYDSARHPTCANFREASAHLIRTWLYQYTWEPSWYCEVGPGKSLVAELLIERNLPLDHLILLDSSPSMLAYNQHWAIRKPRSILGDACSLPLSSHSVDLLVSSLGDPYNVPSFWEETSRVLRTGGVSIFTTPSFEWASAFRGGKNSPGMTLAEFQLSNGRYVYVPSYVYLVSEQVKMIGEYGLLVKELANVPISFLKPDTLSPKLLPERGPNGSVVTGFLVVKA